VLQLIDVEHELIISNTSLTDPDIHGEENGPEGG